MWHVEHLGGHACGKVGARQSQQQNKTERSILKSVFIYNVHVGIYWEHIYTYYI